MKVKAVIFDLGKVLVDFDYGIAARSLALKSKATAEEIRTVIDQSPLLFRYESAQMTTQEFFDEVRRQIGFRGSFEEFASTFADIFTEIREMTGLHSELRAVGFPTFVLSNTNELAVDNVRRNFPFFANFTGYIFSFEHAVLKPHARIYEITEQTTGCHPGEILFLDDKLENVESAARRGWRTVCHRAPEESIQAVRELLGRAPASGRERGTSLG